jgi:hypothetical protein
VTRRSSLPSRQEDPREGVERDQRGRVGAEREVAFGLDGPDGPVLLDGDRPDRGQDLAGGPSRPGEFYFETAAGAALNLNLSASTAVGGVVQYTLE